MEYIKLIIAASCVVGATAFVYALEKNKRFSNLPYQVRQVIIGLIFGVVSVLGTELGTSIGSAVINVRDAAPLVSGLIFGGPAGIIAGLIGGIERYFAAYWGAGFYTQIACAVSTILAGVLAAIVRKVMFYNSRPHWFFGAFFAFVVEIFHMQMVFVTHFDDGQGAYKVVNACVGPMIILNVFAVTASFIVYMLLTKSKFALPGWKSKISQRIQSRLICVVLFGMVVTTVFVFLFQNNISQFQSRYQFILALNDMENNINETSDENILKIARGLAEDFDTIPWGEDPEDETEILNAFKNLKKVSEINVIDNDGIIVASTNPEYLNYNMMDGEQSSKFMELFNYGVSEMAEPYQPISINNNIKMKYAGVELRGGGFVQVGYNGEYFREDLKSIIRTTVHNRHVGETGFVVIVDDKNQVYSDTGQFGMANINTSLMTRISEIVTTPYEMYTVSVGGVECFCMYSLSEGYRFYVIQTADEVNYPRNISIYLAVFMETLVFALLFVVLFLVLRRLVVNSVEEVNESLRKISDGQLEEVVKVETSEEFHSLSLYINHTVDTLKKFIAEATAQYKKELEYAKNIQYSALPHIFPPFPERKEFETWANMMTAKEVGGDFYDFYFVDANKLGFLVADVSGKGVPAALFMMRAKTMIKNLATTGMPVDEVFENANNNLCENNDAEMFVTAWLGILDVTTGHLQFVNAGHNPPLRWQKGETDTFDYLIGKRGLVLAGMEGVPYKVNEVQLNPGDTLFLYTDGVTEATNSSNELYGDDRLKDCLSNIPNKDTVDTERICTIVKEDVDRFVDGADQFDDITMLCIKYLGKNYEN